MGIMNVVAATMQDRSLTYRAMAAQLTEKLPSRIAHTTVINWVEGRNEPDTDFLLRCLVVYQDWRREFAHLCLVAKLPEVFSETCLIEILKSLPVVYQC